MKKIFVDLGGETVGILKRYAHSKDKELWLLNVVQEGGIDDGAYCPAQHTFVNSDGLQNLYDALKAIYEPTVVG